MQQYEQPSLALSNRVLSERELAKNLGLSYWTVRGFRLNKNMPYIATAGRIFYRWDTVQSWFDLQEAESQVQPESQGQIRRIH